MRRLLIVIMVFILGAASGVSAQDREREQQFFSEPTRDEQGLLTYRVTSPEAASITQVRVLLPDDFQSESRYRVMYVLPVEAGIEKRYGDGLAEIARHDLHIKHQLICVAPSFAHLPWYVDHPTAPEKQQESHFIEYVLPLIEHNYPVDITANGRLLLGFSKSGWGAWSLLLRHPTLFERAAAWDAPMMMDRPGKYGSGPLFESPENFNMYQVTRLIRANRDILTQRNRLILTGYGNFRAEHKAMHALLNELKALHAYRDGPARKHDWHSGWVSEAVELLVAGDKRQEFAR